MLCAALAADTDNIVEEGLEHWVRRPHRGEHLFCRLLKDDVVLAPYRKRAFAQVVHDMELKPDHCQPGAHLRRYHIRQQAAEDVATHRAS